jgi:asparagine synthase (glutamine-hydrolysing)
LERAGHVFRSTSGSDPARDRGLLREDTVEAMLRDPNAHRTNLDGSTLWQVGVLELWLQTHVR